MNLLGSSSNRLQYALLLFSLVVSHKASTQIQVPDPWATKRITVSKEEAVNHLKTRVDPVYPSIATQKRIEGTVVLQVLISQDGAVIAARRISGPWILVQATLDAVKQWKYEPFTINGELRQARANVEVPFVLRPKNKNNSK